MDPAEVGHEFIRSMNDLRAEMHETRTEMRKLRDVIADNTKATDSLTDMIQGLGEAIVSIGGRIDVLKGVGGLAARLFGGKQRRG